MSYKTRLNNWAIARLLPSQQWVIVARYRSRSDAEGHLHFVCRRMPNVQFKIVFDIAVSERTLLARS
ncbi:hypothetical protein [Microseira sp. BLCC-F43]|jgi:hypothetical protein|uniref:hypothetical protein n=1 Tax=Microseira sp. BLCC-F43 TaxID=3153602 RepID=UPI0035B92D7E